MPDQEGFTPSEVKVGFFLAFSLALFLAMLLLFGRFSDSWGNRSGLKVYFKAVGTLQSEAPVRRNGEEVGRVDEMRILRLDAKGLEKLPPLIKEDLPNLPLTADERKKLKWMDDQSFQSELRKHLRDRSLIELTLDVRSDGGRKYWLEDEIRLAVNVMGETSIDITSGLEGEPWKPDEAVLGIAGDFFNNLSQSMGEVKAILDDVTHVVGAEDQEAFKRAMGRKVTVMANINKIKETFTKRSETTKEKFLVLQKDAEEIWQGIGAIGERLQPTIGDLSQHWQEAREEMSEHWLAAQDLIAQAREDIMLRWEPIDLNFKVVRRVSEKRIEEAKDAAQGLRVKFQSLSANWMDLYGNFTYLAVQSAPDFQAIGPSFSRSGDNVQKFYRYAMNRKDKMVGNSAKGESDYQTALNIWRSLGRTAFDYYLASGYSKALKHSAEGWVRSEAKLNPKDQEALKARLNALEELALSLRASGQVFSELRSEVEKELVPDFDRKQSCWLDFEIK